MKFAFKSVDDSHGVRYYCNLCAAYVPESEFYPCVVKRGIRKCKKCMIQANIDSRKRYYNPYRKLLNYVKRKWKQSNQDVQLDENDVRYLVDEIFGGKSVLDQTQKTLTLMPWDSTQPCMPWNCILVTKKQARTISSGYTDALRYLQATATPKELHRIQQLLKLAKERYHFVNA